MDDENYRRRWDRKRELYAHNGFTEYSDENPRGRLIVTQDSPEKSIERAKVKNPRFAAFAA